MQTISMKAFQRRLAWVQESKTELTVENNRATETSISLGKCRRGSVNKMEK